ncbi:MAG: nucleoside monophosphate kinase [bacterium]|nr:nucleoside monophosphate kinase [bacterium]
MAKRKTLNPTGVSRPPRMVIFGVQGSGKGTQAELVAKRYGVRHVSTGNIFRSEISKRTALGRRAMRFLASGKLVPDAVTNAMVNKYLKTAVVRRRGFILDGYPRNRSQLRALERLGGVTHVIEIALPDREAVRRIGGRLNCACGASYHVDHNPPRRRNICDRCGHALFVRDDDRPAPVRRRIRIYHRETAPLVSHYRRQGVLLRVDGRPAISVVFRSVVARLRKTLGAKAQI